MLTKGSLLYLAHITCHFSVAHDSWQHSGWRYPIILTVSAHKLKRNELQVVLGSYHTEARKAKYT